MGLAHRLRDGKRSRHQFAAELSGHERALIGMSGEALYNVQFHLICDTLDTVDEVADQETAGRIASALAERWADAPARIAEATKAAEMHTLNLTAPELAALMTRESCDDRGDLYLTERDEYLWALDCRPLVPGGDSLPVLAHLIVSVEQGPHGEVRHSACGQRLTAGNHPRGWWSTSRGRLPLVERDIHCGIEIAGVAE